MSVCISRFGKYFPVTGTYRLPDRLQMPAILATKYFTQRNIFEILFNQTKIGLYLPYSSIDLTKSVEENGNTIRYQFDSIGFQRYFP